MERSHVDTKLGNYVKKIPIRIHHGWHTQIPTSLFPRRLALTIFGKWGPPPRGGRRSGATQGCLGEKVKDLGAKSFRK